MGLRWRALIGKRSLAHMGHVHVHAPDGVKRERTGDVDTGRSHPLLVGPSLGEHCHCSPALERSERGRSDRVAASDLVSIITPAYRASKIIGHTIASVCAQTYANWEMLIADDCSTDGTRDVVRQWTQCDARVRLLELERHGGPAPARNAALQAAQGEWIAFLDADDLWLPTKLERSIAFATAASSPFVFTGFRRMSADGGRSGRYISVPRLLGYRQLLGNTAIATSTVVLNRRVIRPIEMRKTYYDDFDCWLRILKQGHTAQGLDEDLMRYRVMSQSVSRNKCHSARQVWRAYRELERLSLRASLGYFSQYALRGVLKYRKF